MYRTQRLPRLFENQVLRQTLDLNEFANARISCTPRVLLDLPQRGLIESPQGGGGRGILKTFDAEVTGEIAALALLQKETSYTTQQLREIRQLARELENLYPTPETAKQDKIHLQRAWQGKKFLGPAVVSWVCAKRRTLNFLYAKEFAERKRVLADILVRAKKQGETLSSLSAETREARDELKRIEEDERRDDYFESEDFLKFVVMLTYEKPKESKRTSRKATSTQMTADPIAVFSKSLAAKTRD